VSLTDGQDLTIVVESMSHDVSGCAHEDAPTGPVEQQTVTFQLTGAFASISTLNVFFSSFNPSSL